MEPSIIIIIVMALIFFMIAFVLIMFFWVFPASDGPRGIQGEKGSDGLQGFQGSIGAIGPRGSSIGPKGPTGIRGITGIQGDKGWLGGTGPLGFQGSTGMTGVNFIATLQADTDTVFNLNPGFSGATGGTGDTVVFTNLIESFDSFNRFSIVESGGSTITLPSGKYNLTLNVSVDTELPSDPTTLVFHVEDDLLSTLDQNSIKIPSSYIGSTEPYLVPLTIDTTGSTSIKLYAENTTEITVSNPVVAPSAYASHITNLNVLIEGFDL